MMFLLPEEWNLRQHEGDFKRGMLIFADLRRHRMEVRWRTPKFLGIRRDPKRMVERNAVIMRQRRRDAVQLEGGAVWVRSPQGTLLLAADKQRIYELHWPAAPDDAPADARGIEFIGNEFLRGLREGVGQAEYYWSIYGATGWVSAKARLKTASLLPGATSLTFQHGRIQLTLGSFSMAERLLSQAGSLRQWAIKALPIIAAHRRGTWEESETEVVFRADGRRRFRRIRHILTFCHDASTNRIQWTQHTAPCQD